MEHMPDSKQNEELRTLGIYVHIPFCVKKCNYCDFLSMTADEKTMECYIQALLREIEYRAPAAEDCEVDSIFIGGGTPSCLDAGYIQRIMETIRQNYRIKQPECEGTNVLPEVTIECNPGTLDRHKLECYRRAGINRISLGLQSSSDEELRLLGRIHTWEQFLQSAGLVREFFDNWNVDIMSALPGQTTDSCRRTLENVLALEPSHISAYSLIIEEGTPFYEKYKEDERIRQKGGNPHFLPSEEEEREMYEMTGRLLEEHGYHRYEISNYAKEGRESRHNNRYWLREDYLGLGLGVSSLMENVRWNNVADMTVYLQEHPPQEQFPRVELQRLTRRQQMEETMFLGLRRMQGVDTETFAKRFGHTIEDVYGEVIQRLELQQLLCYSGKYIQLTQSGIDVSNYVLSEFLLE